MLSPSSMKPSAPSASLLRFLRSQSDSFFFTANPTTCGRSLNNDPQSHHQHHAFSLSRTSDWTNINPAPCRASLESCLFPLPGLSSRTRGTVRCRASLAQRSSPSPFSLPNAQFSRASSTKSKSFWRRLFDFKRNKAAESKSYLRQPPALINDGTEGSFNIGRGLVAKASNEPRLRCTEFDSTGNVTLVNGEFKKSELIAKVSIGGSANCFITQEATQD